jgi:FkbM family methyltransferase
MTVYDVGANRGQMTLFFSQAVGPSGTVVAFEPVPAVFEDLIANVRLNGMANVKPMCLALADKSGPASFHFNDQQPTQGKIATCEPSYRDPLAAPIEIQAAALDELVSEQSLPPPRLIKIDVEGAAGLIFQGAEQTLASHAPDIYIELHGPEEQFAVKEHLIGRGYRVETLAGAVVQDPTRGWQTPLWCTRG